MTLDDTVRAIADAVAAQLDAKLEARFDALITQDAYTAAMTEVVGRLNGIQQQLAAGGGTTIDVAPILTAIQSAHDGVDANYRLVKALQQGGVAQNLTIAEGDLARIASAVLNLPAPPDHLNLPINLQFGTAIQEYVAYAFAKVLRELLNDATFPQSDPLAPKQ